MKGDELDGILDDALASYTLREPRAGLSARILARVRAEDTAPRWSWLRFAAAGLALAGLVVAIEMRQSETPLPIRVQKADPVAIVPVVRTVKPHRAVQRSPRRESLTREQRALLAFAQQAPSAALELAQPDKPLEIEAINMQPLQIDSLEIGEMK